MKFIDTIKEKAKENKKRIILPESMDERIVEAALLTSKAGIAEIILIGNPIKDINDKNINIINPEVSNLTNELAEKLYELRKEKGITREKAKELLLNDYMYFACMMVKCGYADGVVSGACHSTANTLRPALQIIKASPNVSLVSTFFIMVVPNCNLGENGLFLFSDCGLEQNPTASRLSDIAGMSALSFEKIVGKEPKVAILSHSTKGSATHYDVDKVIEATQMARNKFAHYKIDGELQLDAAIVPDIAKIKAPESEVAGCANVLIFPDLDSGNIGYKLVQRLANAEAYGPLTQGISVPVNDLSRGCSVDDIIGVIAITCVQAMKK